MKIHRCGSERFYGWKEIASCPLNQPPPPSIVWKKEDMCSVITSYGNSEHKGDHNSGFYNYRVSLNRYDLSNLITVLAKASDAGSLGDTFKNNVPDLIKLLASAAASS
jgi:hypothetical protein